MASRSQQRRQREARVQRWNKDHPPGTPVTVTNDDGTQLCTATRSVAWMAGGVVPSVMVEGIADRVPLDRVTPGAAQFHRVAVCVDGIGAQAMTAAGQTAASAIASLRHKVQKLFPGCDVACVGVANG